jgi:hypothetical protein
VLLQVIKVSINKLSNSLAENEAHAVIGKKKLLSHFITEKNSLFLIVTYTIDCFHHNFHQFTEEERTNE